MNYLRCFSTLGCPDLSLDAATALARRRQIPALELRALGGTVDLPAYFAAQYRTPAAATAEVAATGLKIVALGASLRLVDNTAADREQLLQWAPWADALGARWLRVFDGGSSGDDAELTRAAETWAWWQTARAHHGWHVDLMVETHDSIFTAAAIRRLVEAAPGLAVLWDSHHTWKKGGEDPLITWATAREHIVHVHVKDSISAPGTPHGFTYVPPGGGEFPFAALIERLRRDRFVGAVSLEWEKLWHPQLAPLDEALEAAVAQGW